MFLTYNYIRCEWTKHEKVRHVASKQAYLEPNEAKAEQTYAIPYMNHDMEGY